MPQDVALLVDGDNVSAEFVTQLWSSATRLGRVTVARAYLNAQVASDWHSAAQFRLFHAGTGKNAADILLTIQAMELLLAGGFKTFAIASSDGDFSHLALRLREMGADVLGLGEDKAPTRFRSACTAFETLSAKPGSQTQPCRTHLPPACVAKPQSVSNAPKPKELDRQIKAVIAAASQFGQGASLATVGGDMKRLHGITTSQLSEANWRKYLAARPVFFDLDAPGPNAKVRFKPNAFA